MRRFFTALSISLVLAASMAASTRARPQDPLSGQQPTTTQEPAAPNRPSFADFLKGIRDEAISRGIREELVDAALRDVQEPLPVVLERDRTQAETILALEKYLADHVTVKVVRHGREAYAANRELLKQVADRYGVPPGIIVAVWGVESNFGQFTGVRPTIAALATLAWDPRRSAFFRGELFKALEIVNRGDIDLPHLRGSWAGAMGQVQFMPSSYLDFAEDFDGDGKRDIWSSSPDVFASIANYLKAHGWRPEQSWGREVRLSRDADRKILQTVARRNGSCVATRNMTVALPPEEWKKLGVKPASGRKLPADSGDLALVSGQSRHFLVSSNYDALLAYNCAHSYALSVALLGDHITSGKLAGEPAPKGEKKSKTGRRKIRLKPDRHG